MIITERGCNQINNKLQTEHLASQYILQDSTSNMNSSGINSSCASAEIPTIVFFTYSLGEGPTGKETNSFK